MWNNQEKSIVTQSGSDDSVMPMQKLEMLEEKLVKMMEQLSIRSLRHIRRIRADLRQMTQSMSAIKARSMQPGGALDAVAVAAGGGHEGIVVRSNGHTRCPGEFVGVGRWRTCYRFSNFDASWHEAREYCSAFGANLVSLDSMKEAYIIDYLIKSHPGSNHVCNR